jgi:DNA-binding response OmpR family regulator
MSDARLETLEAECERLRFEVEELRAVLFGADLVLPLEWRLTAMQTRMFGVLLARERVSRPQLMSALYGLRLDGEIPDEKIVDVQIFHMRRKLKPFGIEIANVWGQGYALDAATRARFSAARGPDGRRAAC